MRKIFSAVALLALTPLAFAQSSSGSQADSIAQTGPATAIINQPASPDSLKTVGSVLLPANSVSSGGFNCGGTASAGIGVLGGTIGASGSKSLEDCVKLNLLSFTVAAKDANMYLSVWCTIGAGREAMVEAGLNCPADQRAGRNTTSTRDAVAAGPVHSPQ